MHSPESAFRILATPEHPLGTLQPVTGESVCHFLRIRGQAGVVSHAVSDRAAHVGIIADSDVQATVVLSVRSQDCTVEVFVAHGATVHVVCVEHDTDHASAVTLKSRTEAGGNIHWHTVTLGHAVTQRLISELSGTDARSDIDCLFHVHDAQIQIIETTNVFTARGGTGQMRMRGVAQNKGHAVCSGKILIAEEGTGTDTYLTQDVLMLDSTAKVDAIPELEIRTNDVKAGHSATVSRVTEEDLFYFASRGIEEAVARPMFIEGFVRDMLSGIPQPDVREHLEHAFFASVA